MNKKYIDKLLNLNWEEVWKVIDAHNSYVRFEDDSILGNLSVVMSRDGDVWVETFPDPEETYKRSCRFRTVCGGGDSERVRRALLVLAMAIVADNEENKQHRTK